LDWSSHYNSALRHVFDKLSIGYNETMLLAASEVLNKYNTRKNSRIEEVSADQIFKEISQILFTDPENLSLMVKEFFGFFQRESEPEGTALELLNHLKIKEIDCAVLTDVPYGMPKEYVLNDLCKLLDYIDLVVTLEEVGYRKPSTIGLEKIIQYFNTKIENTIYIGNEQKDIEMANNIGAGSVLINPVGLAPNWGQHTR